MIYPASAIWLCGLPRCCSRNPELHLGLSLGHSPVVFLLGFGRISFGLFCTSGSHGTDLLCLGIILSLLLCLSLSASALLSQCLFFSSISDISVQIQLLSFTSTEVKILDFDRVLFGYYYYRPRVRLFCFRNPMTIIIIILARSITNRYRKN